MDAYLNYDEETEEQKVKQMHLSRRLIKDRKNPYITYFRKEEFQIRYRFRKDAAMELTEMVGEVINISANSHSATPFLGSVVNTIASPHGSSSPQEGDLRLLGPPSGQGANGGDRSRNRRVPAHLRADSLATVPPTLPKKAVR
ncbi:hypothetical protein PoB_000975000 [Plakobranchus ocellatus]|uniref:Uncharacterized protein n=1 Tax=Plakobranchus ocellatus TaxID=259542 RepID=A0AAV3YL55_9GAST|nr:hypothetical protein PoB_000975000 [Plakobranchus ocellatus]